MDGFVSRRSAPITLLTLLAVHSARAILVETRCFKELGCFPPGFPYSGTAQRPFPDAPASPQEMNIQLYLQTPENPEQSQILDPYIPSSIKNTHFSTKRPTIMIFHGMADFAYRSWVYTMCKEIIFVKNCNCIGVDWSKGAGDFYTYIQSANNVRVVGAYAAYLIQQILKCIDPTYDPCNYHLIGHSLGAHAAAETGKRIRPCVGKITGLDAARPYFKDTPAEVCLDPSDACVVMAIHTDTSFLGVGIKEPIGHYDIYPNGGDHMPGCPDPIKDIPLSIPGLINTTRYFVGCNHYRARYYMLESIRNCSGFLAFPCESYASFLNGNCFPCPHSGCAYLGFCNGTSCNCTNNGTIQRRVFYLRTGREISRFASWMYKLTVVTQVTHTNLGSMYISLYSAQGNVTQEPIKSHRLLGSSSTDTIFININFEMINITPATFSWSSSPVKINGMEAGAKKISIQQGVDGHIYFCP
uniref:Triacylglycerol lipase n=1 Tax=Leptobrachium leishanense TaxID=445787 RepID=A0A8C5PMS4_9ANUR